MVTDVGLSISSHASQAKMQSQMPSVAWLSAKFALSPYLPSNKKQRWFDRLQEEARALGGVRARADDNVAVPRAVALGFRWRRQML